VIVKKHFHSFVALWMLGIVVLLAGCGRELQQRHAFIGFLQKEVIPRNSGLIIPTKTMRKKFGEYAVHYDAIVDFNNAMHEKVGRPLDKLQRDFAEAMKPEAEVNERKAATVQYMKSLAEIGKILDEEFSRAEERISAFQQPAELQAVYAQAVEKHVRLPAQALKLMIPATSEMLDKNLALLDFVVANKGKILIKDGMIQVRDQSTLTQLNRMQADIAKTAQAIQTQHTEFMQQTPK
jgi:septal ring factor EnvC (AmiA/AmiB activator)